MIKEKKKQGVFCKTVVDFNPDDRRRVAATVLAVFHAPQAPPGRAPPRSRASAAAAPQRGAVTPPLASISL